VLDRREQQRKMNGVITIGMRVGTTNTGKGHQSRSASESLDLCPSVVIPNLDPVVRPESSHLCPDKRSLESTICYKNQRL
jgi:hypothetical protein